MDAVRFGRALGFGARQAVKTVATVVDAATAENPSAKQSRAQSSVTTRRTSASPKREDFSAQNFAASKTAARPQILSPQRTQAQTTDRVQQTARRSTKQPASGVRRGMNHFVGTTWSTFVRLGGVLWLELTGVFFGIFAVFALSGVWKWRAAWRLSASNAHDHQGWMGSVAMAVVFGYFCASSFVRARRRERRR